MERRTVVFFVGAVLVGGLIAGNATAETWQQRMKHADRNKNGKIDRKEMRMEERWEEKQHSQANTWWEKRADTNNDGMVDSGELSTWKDLEKNKLDSNNDGVIDTYERRKCWMHSRSKVTTALERTYDANNDGSLDTSEAKEFLRARYALIKSGGQAKVNSAIEEAYDTNNDGIISSSEAAAMAQDTVN